MASKHAVLRLLEDNTKTIAISMGDMGEWMEECCQVGHDADNDNNNTNDDDDEGDGE